MSDNVVDGATVELQDDGTWSWEAWSGRLKVSAQPRGMLVNGKPVALAEDLAGLASRVAGRCYKGMIHSDIPGVVTVCTMVVNEGTLSKNSTVSGKAVAIKETKGTFTISCVPAFKAGAPPIPDPVPVKNGRWRVIECGQSDAETV